MNIVNRRRRVPYYSLKSGDRVKIVECIGNIENEDVKEISKFVGRTATIKSIEKCDTHNCSSRGKLCGNCQYYIVMSLRPPRTIYGCYLVAASEDGKRFIGDAE